MTVLEKFQLLGLPNESKIFLSNLKKILNEILLLEKDSLKKDALNKLIELYLCCPSKYQVKRIMASFFQNHFESDYKFVHTTLCSELVRQIDVQNFEKDVIFNIRHVVDTIGALLENFKMGEKCVQSTTMPIMKFLIQAENFFLSQVKCELAPIQLQQLMQHCHVTIQIINLVIQKTINHISSQILGEPHLMRSMLEFDLQILNNESFLLDCRCCSAMNIILLLQLAPTTSHTVLEVSYLLLPEAFDKRLPREIPWLADTQAVSLNMDNLSILSCLALAFGYISMVTDSAFITSMPNGKIFYLHCLLYYLLQHGKKCNDTVSKALLGKTVSLWSTRLLQFLEKSVPDKEMAEILNGETEVLKSLLDYVWTHWEDQLDIIRQSAKTVFENVLKIHMVVSKNDQRIDSFITTIIEHLFSVSWACKGKFSALITCVQLVGAGQILFLRPELPSEIVEQLEEQAMSCYCSELYSTFYTTYQQEYITKTTETEKTCLFHIWLTPLVKALCSNRTKLKQNIIEYLLAKILKHGDDVLHYLISSLTEVQVKESCGAIIMCLRKARILGLFKTKQEPVEKQPLWYGYLHPDILKSALLSSDQQIRLDAFGLLCENHKTTEPVSQFEFDKLKFFIPYNLNNQTPAYRQTFLSLSKKFFSRSKESLTNLKKQNSKQHINFLDVTLKNYQEFYLWLTQYLFSSLYPGSSFARRTTSLAMLSLLASFFNSACEVFCVTSLMSSQHKYVLLECLTDTFEENKKEALNLLSIYMQHHGPIWNKKELNEIYQLSMSLACSAKPQDCETAVYNFLLILQQVEQHDVFKLPEMSFSKRNPAESAAIGHRGLELLSVLLDLLEDEISVASHSLIVAAATRPMYPTLLCARYIMAEIDYRGLKPEHIPSAKHFINRLIKSSLTVSKIVSPVVQNSSPEGYMPEDVLKGSRLDHSKIDNNETNCKFLNPSKVDKSHKVIESMPEYLVVCCWRSIKEVSLTLGNLCLQIPASLIADDPLALLTFHQVKMIGDYFSEQLLESIHRGAFELAYAGFQLLCQMLWSHPTVLFHQLPVSWLNQILLDIRSEENSSKFCITRRSAGVPFFIQAITSSEPGTTGKKCFHQVMRELLTLAVIENNTQDTKKSCQEAQIHAINILRALFRDARLGEDVLPYVAEGLKASILGFKSDSWAVRNSSTLLLSALMTRIFGVKRSKDETVMSKKNCQSGRTFFHQYPGLYPFLLSELKSATEKIQHKESFQLHPSLYPVLLVLGRLYPSTIDNPDTNMSLSSFIPYVIRCASSPVYKTRIIASRALLPLVRRNELIKISQQLLANIPESCDNNVFNSLIHGSLLQLIEVMKLVPNLEMSSSREYVQFICSSLSKRTCLISNQNSCFGNLQLALEMIDKVLERVDVLQSQTGEANRLKSSFIDNLTSLKYDSNQAWKPLYVSLQQSKAKMFFKFLGQIYFPNGSHDPNDPISKSQLLACKEMVMKLMQSPLYEVRLSALDALLFALDKDILKYYTDDSFTVTSTISDNDSSVTQAWTKLNQNVLKMIACKLFPELLEIILPKENYHICLQKIYYVLASIPSCEEILKSKERNNIMELFNILMTKMACEGRMEVKAAILRFTAQFVPTLYEEIKKKTILSEDCCKLLTKWTQAMKSYSKTDDSPVLQMNCCHALLRNVRTVLLDTDNLLGLAVFDAWGSLAYLLQEDDLDVKDLAATVACAICEAHPGDYHASYALYNLPSILFNIHGKRNMGGVVSCLIGWIVDGLDVDIKESEERLFDKGEINTYIDPVAFTRSVVTTLNQWFNIDRRSIHRLKLSEFFPLHADKGQEAGCTDCVKYESFNDDSFIVQWADYIHHLTNGLKTLMTCCLKSDVYLNCGRYASLCSTVFRAKLLLLVMEGLPFGYAHLLGQINTLQEQLIQTVNTLELKNLISSSFR